MKILIVIANYVPVHNPNVFRWQAIAEYWFNEGHDVSILTTRHGDAQELELINGVEVFRTGYATLKDIQAAVLGRTNERNIPKAAPINKRDSSGWLEKSVDLTWRKFYWPDGSMPFIKPGIKLGQDIIEKKKIEMIFSVGLPFSCHLIARRLKEKNIALKWHMDIEDPFCYSKEFWVNNFKLYRNKNIREEEKAFQMADQISVTNENARLKYRDFFAEEMHKVKIIPPLHMPSQKAHPINLEDNKIHFGYFGSFYKGVRSPELFLEFLSYIKANQFDWIQDKVFHFFGQANRFSTPIFEAYWELEDYVVLHGLVERDSSISYMEQMDVLINFGNTTSYHLPSKVVDYLASANKIVNIKATDKDSFEKFSKDLDCVLNVSLVGSDSFKEVFEKMKSFLNKSIKDDFNLVPYQIESIAKSYLEDKN